MKKLIFGMMILLGTLSFQLFSWGEEDDNTSKVESLIPTEKRLEEITERKIWEYYHKETTIEQNSKIIESGKFLLKDIGRVHEPINYKFKVPIILIEIKEFQNEDDLLDYWNTHEEEKLERMYEKARFIGTINEDSKCFFDYSQNGAITACHFGKFIIQNTISDQYQEHFDYESNDFEVNQKEISSRIMTEILNNINNNIDQKISLDEILEKRIFERDNIIKKTFDVEKDNKYGVENYSCFKDEFGLITISGQFNNNGIQKNDVDLKIIFLDRQDNPIGENSVNLKNIKEFETKRFVGTTYGDELFFSCSINIE